MVVCYSDELADAPFGSFLMGPSHQHGVIMAKLTAIMKSQPVSKHGKRLWNMRDMAEAKHVEAIFNARVKRGEIKPGKLDYMFGCGCGAEGCFGAGTVPQ